MDEPAPKAVQQLPRSLLHRLTRWLSGSAQGIAHFLFPPLCVSCQMGGDAFLCARCRAGLKGGRSLVAGEELLVLGDYPGTLQLCLTAIKHQGHRALAAELAQLCAQRITQAWGKESSMVVYSIKPSRAGQRYRGFSLPGMMEQAVLARTGWPRLPIELTSLFPDSQGSSQGLNLEERLQRRRRGQSEPPEPLHFEAVRGPLLILDDVVTSGATLGAAVAAAQQAGFSPVRCFAIAVAEAPVPD